MTTYAHDPVASSIVASWPTGDGAVARRVARIPRNGSDELARRTAAALTRLSVRLWLAWSEQEIEEIRPHRILEAVRYPHQPVGDMLQIEEDDRVEAAHILGRVVSDAPGRAFRDAVVAEVGAELDAIGDAADGDLTGRARQAVVHVRPYGPDVQVGTAHALLHDDPIDPWRLLTTVEPYAAGIAALRWLRVAAELVAGRVGHTGGDVVALAEAIEHEDLRVAREALGPRHDLDGDDLVRDLLQEALLAERGFFVVCPDRPPSDLLGDGEEHRHTVVTTVLDPAEPGKCLVDGLVRGIQGCFRVYLDEITTRERPGVDPRLTGPEWAAALRERFVAELREAMRTSW